MGEMGGNYTIQLKSQSLIHQGISLTKRIFGILKEKYNKVAIPYSSGNFSNIDLKDFKLEVILNESQSLIHQGISLTSIIRLLALG